MVRSLKSLLVFGFLILVTNAHLHGQDDSTSGKRGWSLETFRVITQALRGEPAEKLPPEHADHTAWDQAIAASTLAWRKAMKSCGLDFGDETKILYDPETETLSIYASPTEVTLLENYTEVLGRSPSRIICNLEVLEGPSATVRELAAKAQAQQNHVTMFHAFEALVARHEGKRIGTLRLETRSGQRTTMQSGPEQTYPRAFIRNEPGAITALTETRCTGVTLLMDPVLGPDGWRTDLNYELEVHSSPPQKREVLSPPLGDSQMRKLPVLDFCLARVTSAFVCNGDHTKLLGVWTPCELDGQPRKDALQAAFLHVMPVSGERALNPLVERKLREHLHRQGRIPTVDAYPELAVPVGTGLKRQVFKVPRGFTLDTEFEVTAAQERALSVREDRNGLCLNPASAPIQSGPVPDPFLPSDSAAGWQVLFPMGTDLYYHQHRHVLEVVHTEEGLREVGEILETLWDNAPKTLAFTLHLVQGDGSTLREMARDSATHTDHTSTWVKMEELVRNGKATVLATQRLETVSGQNAKLVAGWERATVDAFEKTDKGAIEAKTGSSTSGITWEIAPLQSPDFKTIDVDLALEYHFAPPQPSPPEANLSADVGMKTEKTYAAKVRSAHTLQSGTTRLISLWKPSGTPELDGQDVMQAAFLRADVVPLTSREDP